MKTILIDKNGFGIASLFTKNSVKEVISEQKGLNGYYLEELNISYNIGDIIKLLTPLKHNQSGFFVHNIRVYDITENEYKCEFI